ncbi:MAG TPA: zf-HC2 domain-containing protein [Planctomycetota bacterium]|nr:zf-HC2 domain-containing protein [Planctomycetota bacterium]
MTADCRWTRARIIAGLDGELAVADREAFEAHLASCPACRAAADGEKALAARVRAVGRAVRAPQALADRIRLTLAEAQADGPATEASRPGPRRRALPRRALGWTLALASAAAVLLVVGSGVFWPGSGRGLVAAMAAEHYEHSSGRAPQLLDITSADSAAIEGYLSKELGISVKLPSSAFPARRGATCCRDGKQSMGLVACFCQRRSHAVTLFIVRSEGLSLRGLEMVQRDGREFWRGSAEECRALLWKSGPVCYAVVGEFKDPADHLDLAVRTAVALEARPGQ